MDWSKKISANNFAWCNPEKKILKPFNVGERADLIKLVFCNWGGNCGPLCKSGFEDIAPVIPFSVAYSGFKLAIHEPGFADRLCFLADSFKQFFVKFANQNFLSVRIFDLRENQKISVYTSSSKICLLQKVLNCILLSHIWITFWSKNSMGELTAYSPYPLSAGTT